MRTMAADLPEECLGLFEMAFRSVNMITTGYLPTYPDARIVVVHRDPAQVLPSVASMLGFVRSRLGPVDPRDTGREVFDEWSKATERLIAYRAPTSSSTSTMWISCARRWR